MITNENKDIFMRRFFENDKSLEVFLLDHSKLSSQNEFETIPIGSNVSIRCNDITSSGSPCILYAPEQFSQHTDGDYFNFFVYIIYDGELFNFHYFENQERNISLIDETIYKFMGDVFDKEKVETAIEYVKL